MDSATQGLPGVYVYLDDVLVASKSEVEHLRQLRALCSALRKFVLVVKEQKCVFGKSKVEFLRHEVSAAGISPLRHKVEAIQNFKQPESVKSLQRYLGMLNFYRRFLPNIANTLLPLTNALAGKP